MNIFKLKLTEEDIKLQNVIKTLLGNKDTLIEVNPSNMSYMLSHEGKQYYVLVDSVGVQISNHNFAKDIRLEHNKIDAIKELISEEASKRRNIKQALIFKNNNDLLDTIINNLKVK